MQGINQSRHGKQGESAENDAKAQKTMQEQGKRCRGAENNAGVRKTMKRHGKQCKGEENNAKAQKMMQGAENDARHGAKPKQRLGSMHGGGSRHKKQ